MSNEGTIFFLALFLALSPFLGLPYAWLMVIVPVLALLTAAFAILARARRLVDAHAPETSSRNETETISAA